MSKCTYICQHCGKTFQAYPLAGHVSRQYCSDHCSKQSRRKYKDTQCPTCGKVFAPRLSKGGNKVPQIFCSAKCRQARNPDLIDAKVCLQCGQGFQIYKNKTRTRKNRGQYCSTKCARESQKDPSSFTIQQCLNCNESFQVAITQIKYRNGGKYCSNKCRVEYCIGKKHPRWKDNKTIYDPGPNWHTQRQKALERDEYRCQNCGKCLGDSVLIDVHHITPCRLFDGDEQVNDLSNLITLCRKCHRPIEVGKIPCPIPKS